MGMKKNYKENTKELKARHRANYKIKIPVDQLCEKCKINKAIEKHHEDYNKPLEVKFLCRVCHNKMPKKRIKRLENLERDILSIMQKGERYYVSQLKQLLKDQGISVNWKTVDKYLEKLAGEGKVRSQKVSAKLILWYR